MDTKKLKPIFDEKLPSWKRGLIHGFIAGGIVFILVFGFIIHTSTIPAISDVSLSLAYRPWWKFSNWIQSFFCSVPFFIVFGSRAALIKIKKR